jgi:hypothetical protein
MDYKTNKNKVIDYLVENVLDVEKVIPDVVQGKFAAKLK